MKKIALLLFTALLLVTTVHARNIDPTFDKLYAKFKQAVDGRDPKALAAMLAPGFVEEEVSGATTSADKMLVELARLPQDPHRQSQTTLLSVNSDGHIARITQRYRMTTIKTLANGEKKSIELVALSDDTWTHADGTWRIQRTVTEQVDYRMGGKLLAHKVHAAS
jgi:hypothetical protein